MHEIIQWLLKVEQVAGRAYANAAICFNDDPEFVNFLYENAEAEAWHYHVMASAAEHLRKIESEMPVIAIDEKTNQNVLEVLIAINDNLECKNLSKEDFLKTIAETEFSEWNDIFVYVVNYLKKHFKEFSVVSSKIQSHKRAIEVYLEKFPKVFDKISKLRALPKIWEEKILIIEDDESVSGLLQAILQNEGRIDIAGNGKQGYDKIEQKYYKLIISDVNMPEMDGIELYNIVKNLYPGIGDRYLFLTGNLSPEQEQFFKQNNLAFLAKPASVSQIRQYALDLLLAN